MKCETIFLPADTRKFEDFGFMQAYLSFKPNLSPERRSFGKLITIDDGILQPAAKGFGFHPHNNVEVVTFMVEGEVNHIDPNDSSHNGTLKAKGIQIITAGSGIVHNEENNSATQTMRALQIWFKPREKNLSPSFSRKHLPKESYNNKLTCILSPNGLGDSLIIQQDAYLNYGNFQKSQTIHYQPKIDSNHSFIYIINGRVELLGKELSKGDGLGIKDSKEVSINILDNAEFLLFDTPQ